MDILRQFKHANVLRVAAADIVEALPLMKVSDHLTWIAETVLDEALEQARRLSSAGNRRDAVRYLFLAALLSLEKRGLIRTDRSRTNQEVLDSLSDYPNIQAQLHGLILVFDRVWYGYHPLDDEAFSAFEIIVNRLNTREEQA